MSTITLVDKTHIRDIVQCTSNLQDPTLIIISDDPKVHKITLKSVELATLPTIKVLHNEDQLPHYKQFKNKRRPY